MPIRLPPLQPRSRPALIAAEYAKGQGRFDAFHRAVFAAFFQQGLDIGSPAVLEQIAAEVGLDPAGVTAALRDAVLLQRVVDQEEDALALGIYAVPTLIIGGRAIEGLPAYPLLERALKTAA